MRFLIKNYIDKLSVSDVYKFGLENGVNLTEDEANTIYGILKNRWEEIIYGDFPSVLGSVRGDISDENMGKIESLFYLYKEKYKDYL